MPRGTAQGYLKDLPYKPAPQGFEGQAAGGRGSFGCVNAYNGESNVMYDEKGTFGKTVASGDASGAAKSLIANSTGMQVESATPASAFPKP